MTNDYSISIVLDKRRKRAENSYPVRLRVFTTEPRAQKMYATVFNFTEKEFASIWETLKPRSEYKEMRLKLQTLLTKANEVASKLGNFALNDFERLMYGTTDRAMNVNYYYAKIDERLRKAGRFGTADSYALSLKCLLRFHEKPNIDFKQITASYLEQFEKFCVEKENKSLTTVGIYLRALRVIFNEAIHEKTISPDLYPFGKRRYQIKAPKGIKKALTDEQMKTLFEGEPKTDEQAQAKAFWFFSYLSNGMNLKDILSLKWKDIDGDKFTFVRAKTARSVQSQTPITVYLNNYTQIVIDTYGNENRKPNDYVFPCFDKLKNTEAQYKAKLHFIRYVNQHFLNYAQSLGISEKISSYYARHTFSTKAIRKGASIEFVGEALGHTDIKTTMNYFAGFEDKAKKDISKALLDF